MSFDYQAARDAIGALHEGRLYRSQDIPKVPAPPEGVRFHDTGGWRRCCVPATTPDRLPWRRGSPFEWCVYGTELWTSLSPLRSRGVRGEEAPHVWGDLFRLDLKDRRWRRIATVPVLFHQYMAENVGREAAEADAADGLIVDAPDQDPLCLAPADHADFQRHYAPLKRPALAWRGGYAYAPQP